MKTLKEAADEMAESLRKGGMRSEIDALRAENARLQAKHQEELDEWSEDCAALEGQLADLQARVEEAEGGAQMLRQELDAAAKRELTALRERDGYEALAERRGEALVKQFKDMHLPAGPRPRKVGCSVPCGTCDSARAAIDALPEEAGGGR